jgi:hypothetical protein
MDVPPVLRICLERAFLHVVKPMFGFCETDWRAAKAVPRGELPLDCANAAFSRIRWVPE